MTQPPDYGQTPPPSDGASGMTPPPPPPPAPGASGGAYSVGDAFNWGFEKFKANVGPSLILALIVLLALGVLGGTSLGIRFALVNPAHINMETGALEGGSGFVTGMFTNGIFSAFVTVAQIAIGALVVRAGLNMTQGKAPDVGEITADFPWVNVIVLGLIQAGIVFIGTILCLIPGLIASFLLYYSTYFLLDKGLEPVDALKASYELVKNNVGSALVWVIVAFVITLVGACFCGLGLLVAIPVATYGTAYTYKKLTGQPVAA